MFITIAHKDHHFDDFSESKPAATHRRQHPNIDL